MTIERMIVGVDGSENARRALLWALELGEPLGSEIVAVHALGLLTRRAEGSPAPVEAHREEIGRSFEHEWCRPLAESTVPSRRVLVEGDPVTGLLEASRRERADLIVVGTRGTGGRPELLLGSTSHAVAQHAGCPVTIVPTP